MHWTGFMLIITLDHYQQNVYFCQMWNVNSERKSSARVQAICGAYQLFFRCMDLCINENKLMVRNHHLCINKIPTEWKNDSVLCIGWWRIRTYSCKVSWEMNNLWRYTLSWRRSYASVPRQPDEATPSWISGNQISTTMTLIACLPVMSPPYKQADSLGRIGLQVTFLSDRSIIGPLPMSCQNRLTNVFRVTPTC